MAKVLLNAPELLTINNKFFPQKDIVLGQPIPIRAAMEEALSRYSMFQLHPSDQIVYVGNRQSYLMNE